MLGSIHRLGMCAIVGLALALMAPVTHAAPPPRSIELSVSPAVAIYPGQPTVTYRAAMTAGNADTGFELSWTSPAWPGPVRPQGRGYLGSALVFGDPVLEGPGTLTKLTAQAFLKRDNFIEGPCVRGGPIDAHRLPAGRYRVDVPANQSTTLVVTATVAAPPRQGMDWSSFFTGLFFDPTTFVGPVGILEEAVPLQVEGPVGVDVEFRFPGEKTRLWQLEGRSPKLIGSTDPPMRRRVVKVRAISTGKKATRSVDLSRWKSKASESLGKYRTDNRGRFVLRSRKMPMSRYYRIVARYDDPGPGLTADWDCGPTFNTWPFTG